MTDYMRMMHHEIDRHFKNVFENMPPRIEWSYEKDMSIVRKSDGTTIEIPRYKLEEPGKIFPVSKHDDHLDVLGFHTNGRDRSDLVAAYNHQKLHCDAITELERRLANVKSVAESNVNSSYRAADRYSPGWDDPRVQAEGARDALQPQVEIRSVPAARPARRPFWSVLRAAIRRAFGSRGGAITSDAAGSGEAIVGRSARLQRSAGNTLRERYREYL